MNYNKYLLCIEALCIIGVIPLSYTADCTTTSQQIPTDLYPQLLCRFFGHQRKHIYQNTILPHELVGTIQLAFKLQNIDFLAAVEMRRFVHSPTRARTLIYDEKPVLLINLLQIPVENKDLVRTNLLYHLATCVTSYKPRLPFYIPASGKSVYAYCNHRAGSSNFLNPILRRAEKPYLFVLHNKGYSTIIKKNETQDLEHLISEPYSFACGSNPWPLVIRTKDGKTLSLNLTDNETLIESEATDAEISLLDRTITKSNITVLYDDVTNKESYVLPLEIMPDHYELKAHKFYHVNDQRPSQYGFYDKKQDEIYLLTINDEVLHIDTFTLPHLIRNNNGIDRLLLCAISGYKNMQCHTSDETLDIVQGLTEAIITQFSSDEDNDTDDDIKHALCELIQSIHKTHLVKLECKTSSFYKPTEIPTDRGKISLEHYE